jgi:hypothetical protein
MTEMITSFPHLLMPLENAVHRPPGAEVTLLVEQSGIYLARRLISKARTIESFSNNGLLLLAQRARRRLRRRWRGHLR